MTGSKKCLWKVNKLREATQPKLLYIDKEQPSDPEVIYKSIVSRSVSEFGAMDVDTWLEIARGRLLVTALK